MTTTVKKSTLFASILLIVILGFAVYYNSLNGEFLWDDIYLVEKNTYIRDWAYLPQIFKQDIGAGAEREWTHYRPLQTITYMADYSLWELNPKGYHLTNILLHVLVGLSIFWFVNILCGNPLTALLTSIFYIIHPIHTGAVAYISGRADPLASIFVILCFIFYIKSLHSKSIFSYMFMLLAFPLALLSRENSVILPALLLVYHSAFKKKLDWLAFIPLLIMAFIYLFIRVTILKDLLSTVPYTSTALQRLPGFFVAITNYIRLLIFPFNLHIEYGAKLFSLANLKAIIGISVAFGAITYAFKRKETNALMSFSILWFFVALLTVTNLVRLNAYMAEHWLYLPSIGFFVIVSQFLASLCQSKDYRIPSSILVIILFTTYAFLTIKQNTYWNNALDFYQKTVKYVEDLSLIHI